MVRVPLPLGRNAGRICKILVNLTDIVRCEVNLCSGIGVNGNHVVWERLRPVARGTKGGGDGFNGGGRCGELFFIGARCLKFC